MKKIILILMLALGVTSQAQEFDFSCEEASEVSYTLDIYVEDVKIGSESHVFTSDNTNEVATLTYNLSDSYTVTNVLEMAGDFLDPNFINGIELSVQPIAIGDKVISIEARLKNNYVFDETEANESFMVTQWVVYTPTDAEIQADEIADLLTEVGEIEARVAEILSESSLSSYGDELDSIFLKLQVIQATINGYAYADVVYAENIAEINVLGKAYSAALDNFTTLDMAYKAEIGG